MLALSGNVEDVHTLGHSDSTHGNMSNLNMCTYAAGSMFKNIYSSIILNVCNIS